MLPRTGSPVAIVGLSITDPCGVRDHAKLLAGEFADQGFRTSVHWLDREQRSFAGANREIGSWLRELRAQLSHDRPQMVVIQYSVFSYAHIGLPAFVPAVLGALRPARAPLVGVLHEFVYPWDQAGLHGKVWAMSQRAALIALVKALAGVVLTVPERVSWTRGRPWLPRRPLTLAPVFSNLPAPDVSAPAPRAQPLVGLFGYGLPDPTVGLVLDSLLLLRESGVPASLRLLGRPGPHTTGAERWRREARTRRLAGAVSFSEFLPPQQLSNALATCDALLFADTLGPTSRKGTLAASLASGRAVVALDGPQTWDELRDAGAACLVERSPRHLADTLHDLLLARGKREALGASGRDFAASRMSVRRTAGAVLDALAAAEAGGAGRS